ncbi:branched-chain amino acid ABC transporter permease [Nocardioides sp. JQ2195]|uniref:AzlC family ABC transporter permease n=1 Tax=Nocardioides sp. JQ2195 TaxID=2592334 RepID=UPI00143EECB2|nr:AzlC family ABC transporter permease [Nocardioides sp. JQ2195]QIX28366.1 branched-chain amino acid ABC transporter permease [Nocardioides sp. JQ2195]
MRAHLRDLSERLGPGTLRDILLVNLAVGIVGVSYGAITVGEGLPLWAPNLMSVVVLGGASQFLFTGIVASGGSPVAAVLAGLLVNARHLPFGFALADSVRNRPLLGSYLMIDEVVAFALVERDAERRRLVFFTCGTCLWIFWNIGSLIGGLLGNAIDNTDAFGLDTAFPAVLIALVMPALRDRRTRVVAVVGALVAVGATPFVPTGVAVLLALTALVLMPVLRTSDGPVPGRRDLPGGGAG